MMKKMGTNERGTSKLTELIDPNSRLMRGWVNGWDFSEEIQELADFYEITSSKVHEALREIYEENKEIYT